MCGCSHGIPKRASPVEHVALAKLNCWLFFDSVVRSRSVSLMQLAVCIPWLLDQKSVSVYDSITFCEIIQYMIWYHWYRIQDIGKSTYQIIYHIKSYLSIIYHINHINHMICIMYLINYSRKDIFDYQFHLKPCGIARLSHVAVACYYCKAVGQWDSTTNALAQRYIN